jgi:hypothetical protein
MLYPAPVGTWASITVLYSTVYTLRGWPGFNTPRRFWLAPARRGERGDFGDFSTAHSNGTNKVIDTQGTFCYSLPCIPKLTLAEPTPTGTPLSHSTPFLSMVSALFCAMELTQPFSFQSIPHSFYRHGGVYPLSTSHSSAESALRERNLAHESRSFLPRDGA